LFLAGTGAASFVGGLVELVRAGGAGLTPGPFFSVSNIVLMIVGAAQLKLGLNAWRLGNRRQLPSFGIQAPLWRWLLAGSVLCFVIILPLGPGPDRRHLFLATLAVWFTGVWAVQLTHSAWQFKLPGWAHSRLARWTGHAACIAAAALVAVEIGLEIYSRAAGDPLPVTYVVRRQTLPPGASLQGRNVNRLGYWDDDFQADARPGTFRIAVLGDELALSGTAETNFAARTEKLLPGVELLNFGVCEAGPREYAALAPSQAAAYHPQLIVALLAVATDITEELPLPDRFDLHGLQLYQLGAQTLFAHRLASGELNPILLSPADQETYLQTAAARIEVCRTPMPEPVRDRWNEVFGHLAHLAAACRALQIDLALVVAPADFQVDDNLRKTLCRRRGLSPQAMDLDLPQRRLAVFARRQELPVLDLLPQFRAAGEPLFVRYGHRWNDRGNALAAEALAAWLAHRFPQHMPHVAQATAAAPR
jgi:hypothetical protein